MEKYATVPTMTGPIDPTEAEGPRVIGAFFGHELPHEVVVELIEPLPLDPDDDMHYGSEASRILSALHFGANPSGAKSARTFTNDTAVHSGVHSTLDDAVSPRDPHISLEPGALCTTVEGRVSCTCGIPLALDIR